MKENCQRWLKLRIWILAGLLGVFSCTNPGTPKDAPTSDSIQSNPVSAIDTIPPYRTQVNNEPVAQFIKKTDNPINDWYFKVAVFETKKTFEYLLKMQYEEIRGTDTLRLPNFGTMPAIQIKNGAEPFSCIVGFLDKNKQFKEYKKVFVKNNVLKVTALNHYVVYKYRKLIEK